MSNICMQSFCRPLMPGGPQKPAGRVVKIVDAVIADCVQPRAQFFAFGHGRAADEVGGVHVCSSMLAMYVYGQSAKSQVHAM